MESTGDIRIEISKETNSRNGRDNKMEIVKWEIVLFYYYNSDKCNGYVIGLTSQRGQHSEEDKEQREEDSHSQAGSNMAPKRGKRDKKMEEGTSDSSKDQRKRGRKSGSEHMKTLIDAYMVGNQPNIRAQIVGWERALNDNVKNQDIPIEEWESMVSDPGNSRVRHSLFRKTIQHYWVMKYVVAWAITLNREKTTGGKIEAKENTKEKDPVRVELLREIATIQIQTYRNNLALRRIE